MFLGKHRDLIVRGLAASQPTNDAERRVHDKYRWLAAYHDWFLEESAGAIRSALIDLKIDHTPAYETALLPFGHDIPSPPDPFTESA